METRDIMVPKGDGNMPLGDVFGISTTLGIHPPAFATSTRKLSS
jgi:hypothetical protein